MNSLFGRRRNRRIAEAADGAAAGAELEGRDELVRLAEVLRTGMPGLPTARSEFEEKTLGSLMELYPEAMEGPAEEVEPPVRRRRAVLYGWTAAAAAVAVIIGFVIFLLVRGGPTIQKVATIKVVKGSVTIVDEDGKRSRARPGSVVAEGSRVETGRRAWASIRFENGCISRLGRESDIEVVDYEPSSVKLAQGSGIAYHLVQGRVSYSVACRGVTVTASGTAFLTKVQDRGVIAIAVENDIRITAGDSREVLEQGLQASAQVTEGVGRITEEPVERDEFDPAWLDWNIEQDRGLGVDDTAGVLSSAPPSSVPGPVSTVPPPPPGTQTQPPPEEPRKPQPTPEPSPQPQPQASLSGSTDGNSNTLTWSISGVGQIDSVAMLRSESSPAPSYPSDLYRQLGNAPASSYQDSPVYPGHTYYYRVLALSGGAGVAASNTVAITVPNPTVGATLSASAGTAAVHLSWSISGSAAYNGVIITRSEITQDPDVPPEAGEVSTYLPGSAQSGAYTDTGVTPGRTYNYRLGVTRDHQVLVYSNTAGVTVP